jgi:hypothetical protein
MRNRTNRCICKYINLLYYKQGTLMYFGHLLWHFQVCFFKEEVVLFTTQQFYIFVYALGFVSHNESSVHGYESLKI